jgi:hypothetical protein
MDYLVSEAPLPPELTRELSGLTLATITGGFYFYAF